MLDKLHWISDSIKLQGCAKCRSDFIPDGLEDIVPPYFSRLSPKLVNKGFLARMAARNVVGTISDEEGCYLAFIDKDQFGVVELAREIVKAWSGKDDSVDD